MNKITLYGLLVIGSLSIGLLGAAQDTSNTIGHVGIASPTAASLGKYGDIPVSYNTGLPQINIPLYTVDAGSLKLPIGLSYHASGLKVQENASWVGAGWSLNAGGVITRTVRGAPDDRGLSGYNICQYGHYSDYGFNSYLFVSGDGVGAVNGMVPDDHNFVTGVKDGEPDLYFFNFGGYSGKFYFNDDRTPVLLPEQDCRIAPDLDNGTGGLGFRGFVVTTPDGVKYYFGKTGNNGGTDPVEVTIASTLENGPATANAAVSSWFLNKIVSADGVDSITFTYASEQYSYYTMSMYPVTNIQSHDIMSPANAGYNVVKNFVQGVRLTGITFPNGQVNFGASDSARKDLSAYSNQAFADVANTESFSLGSVQITDNHHFCKKFKFFYDYFYDPNDYTLNGATYNGFSITSDQYRLRLDSIQESSCDGGLHIPPYKFSYFPELVPRKLSFGVDHWGFSNGVTNNSTLVLTYTYKAGNDVEINTGGNRDAAWPAMRGGSLQQITYPTGGTTKLGFEANDTYSQRTIYADVLKNSSFVGFGSTSASISGTTDASSNLYRLELSSSGQTSGVSNTWEIYDASNNFIHSESINAGAPTKIVYFTLPSSTTYHGTFSTTANDGKGNASAYLHEQTSSTSLANVTVGGLRIKTDTTSDGITANDHIRTYTYTPDGGTASSGILYSRPVYVQSIRNDIFGLVYGPTRSVNGCETPDFISPLGSAGNYYISPASITPMSTFQGNHIGYNEVKVAENGNGYCIYRYYGSNVWDSLITDVCTRYIDVSTCSLSIPNFPATPEPFEPQRGELKFEGHFNEAGHAIKSSTYTYVYSTDPLTTPGITYVSVPGLYSFTPYSLQSAKKAQTTVVSALFDPNSDNAISSTSTSYNGSAFHNQPTRKVSTTSTGDSLISTIKYAMDFRITACDAVPDSLPYFNAAMVNDSLHADSGFHTCDSITTDWVCRYDSFQVLRRGINLVRLQYIHYRLRSFSDTGFVASCYFDSLLVADALLRPVLRLQNEFYNAAVETAEFRDGNLRHANFTQYDTSQSPIGVAYPGKTQLINIPVVSGSFTDATVSGRSIARDGRYQDESIYHFANGNPLQVVPFNKVSTAYIWDYSNKYPIAKVMGAAPDQTAYTSFEADGTGNWTIGSSSRDTTTAITGRKFYVLSSDISKSGLSSGTTYFVTYWTQNTGPFTISGTLSGYPQRGKTINGWTLYTHKVTGQTTISLSGNGHIDELRLYPVTAQMTTYTYDPLVGMTSQTDVGNRASYYEYDGLARLKRIRDQDYNILKTYEYQYQQPGGCGSNCTILTMQTLAGSNTLSYPVGVFNIHGKLLDTASNQAAYVTKWNSDTADARIGTLAAGADSMHFQLALNTGQQPPAGVTGCRYYQYDLAWNVFDAVRSINGTYVDFGDGTGMYLGKNPPDTPAVIAPNTTYGTFPDPQAVGLSLSGPSLYLIHSYPDTSLKTITFYHNDAATQTPDLDNLQAPATSMTKLTNFRGNIPQHVQLFGGSSYQQASAWSVANIPNWNSISSLITFDLNTGDLGAHPPTHVSYAQDFMTNNRGLKNIKVSLADTSFKLHVLKSDWNTYFTQIEQMLFNEPAWDHEDLSALTRLRSFFLGSTSPIDTTIVNAIIHQVANGAGKTVLNGGMALGPAGTSRTSASDADVAFLKSKGWTILIGGVTQ